MLVAVETAAELFELRLTLLEQETRLCSTRFDAQVRIERFEERVTHRTEIWIACDDWDAFVARLAPAATEQAVLLDLSQEWRLTVASQDASGRVELAIKQRHYGAGALSLSFATTLTDQQVREFARAFTTWPRWWVASPRND